MDYKSILTDTFLKIGHWVQIREGAEIEIAKLKQFYYATLNLVPESERVEFQKQVDELGVLDDGLSDAIKNVLLAADGWMTTAMVRDKLRRMGFDFGKYESNPLASIGTILRRWKPEEVETAQVEGVNAYRWKKNESSTVPLSDLLDPEGPFFKAISGLKDAKTVSKAMNPPKEESMGDRLLRAVRERREEQKKK